MKYRGDIDGLRALAVLAVVIYHFKKNLGFNGYMGVDIFFVISGYLITRIIYDAVISPSGFSIRDFYQRRARRILPALFTVMIFTLIAAYCLFLPTELLAFAKSSFAATFFSSNFLFWAAAGYFDADAYLKPLLHTWSLAVEEQFYIVFPLIIMGLHKYAKNLLKPILVTLFFLSLIASIVVMHFGWQSSAFYLFPLRAWELLAGSILALNILPKLSSIALARSLSLIGFILIALGIGIRIEDEIFPGLTAMPVVFGTALIIYAGQFGLKNLWVNDALNTAPMRFIGKISYSLYLWHWPIIVFAKYYFFDHLNIAQMIPLFALCVGLSYLSWRFVEQPVRAQSYRFSKSKPSFIVLALFIASLIGCGALIATSGKTHWHDAELLKITSAELRRDWPRIKTFNGNPKDFVFGTSNNIEDASILVIGDSHAVALTYVVNEIAKERRETGLLLRNDCLTPIEWQDQIGKLKPCAQKTQEIIAYVNTHPQIKTIIIVQRWSVRNNVLRRYSKLPQQEMLQLREDALTSLVSQMSGQGRTIIISGEMPDITDTGANIPSIYARLKMQGSDRDLRPDYDRYLRQQGRIPEILQRIADQTGAKILWPDRVFCRIETGFCDIEDKNGLFYYDDDHMSSHGAMQLKPAFDQALE